MKNPKSWPNAADGPLVTAKKLLRAYKDGERKFHFINLDGAVLRHANLSGASFYYASMRNVDLSETLLSQIQLKGADLTGASLEHAFVPGADLISANFTAANLRKTDFVGAAMNGAICVNADMRFAYLGNAGLSEVNLKGARLTGIKLSGTYMDNTDIRPFCSARGVKHESPSSVDARTIMRSYTHAGLKQFLIDCGVPSMFAEYMIDCARALGEPLVRKMLQSTFLSYGAPDERFARQLYDALRAHGVVVFFFPETARVGERINDEVFRQIQKHDRVLLICSRSSLKRPGVINEIQETLDREARDGGATYLLPIMLDDYVLTGWRKVQPVLAERIGHRVVADFRNAKRGKAAFATALDRVIDALKIKSPSAEKALKLLDKKAP